MSNIKPVIEQYIYRRKNIQVGVKIDYTKKTISLVEHDGTKKDYCFVDRGLEYMQGWRDILMVMDEAIDHATERLKSHADKDFEDFAVMLYKVQEATSEKNK